jgi:hypothetical protein
MPRSKSGTSRRRTQIRQRHKRHEKAFKIRVKIAKSEIKASAEA